MDSVSFTDHVPDRPENSNLWQIWLFIISCARHSISCSICSTFLAEEKISYTNHIWLAKTQYVFAIKLMMDAVVAMETRRVLLRHYVIRFSCWFYRGGVYASNRCYNFPLRKRLYKTKCLYLECGYIK